MKQKLDEIMKNYPMYRKKEKDGETLYYVKFVSGFLMGVILGKQEEPNPVTYFIQMEKDVVQRIEAYRLEPLSGDKFVKSKDGKVTCFLDNSKLNEREMERFIDNMETICADLMNLDKKLRNGRFAL